MTILADWNQGYQSIAAMEKDLRNFKFTGPGWYTYKGDTLLITDDNAPSRSGPFRIYCWNNQDPRDEWTKLMRLPQRQSE